MEIFAYIELRVGNVRDIGLFCYEADDILREFVSHHGLYVLSNANTQLSMR